MYPKNNKNKLTQPWTLRAAAAGFFILSQMKATWWPVRKMYYTWKTWSGSTIFFESPLQLSYTRSPGNTAIYSWRLRQNGVTKSIALWWISGHECKDHYGDPTMPGDSKHCCANALITVKSKNRYSWRGAKCCRAAIGNGTTDYGCESVHAEWRRAANHPRATWGLTVKNQWKGWEKIQRMLSKSRMEWKADVILVPSTEDSCWDNVRCLIPSVIVGSRVHNGMQNHT